MHVLEILFRFAKHFDADVLHQFVVVHRKRRGGVHLELSTELLSFAAPLFEQASGTAPANAHRSGSRPEQSPVVRLNKNRRRSYGARTCRSHADRSQVGARAAVRAMDATAVVLLRLLLDKFGLRDELFEPHAADFLEKRPFVLHEPRFEQGVEHVEEVALRRCTSQNEVICRFIVRRRHRPVAFADVPDFGRQLFAQYTNIIRFMVS
mmetsp:Transcript_4617/g.7318  ORF Transcript_4617/g.7318 Transcript_4617/m.7318 type:complete len:208 (+) Transcript_4617:2205-2828(+)